MLQDNGLRASMGRLGSRGDNAAMGSFFSLVQRNVLDTRRWHSRDELRLAIVSWIETQDHRTVASRPWASSPPPGLN